MNPVTPLPRSGEALLDARGPGRALRVSWHDDAGVVVLSVWSGDTCTATFRLRIEEVPALVNVLCSGLARSYDVRRPAAG